MKDKIGLINSPYANKNRVIMKPLMSQIKGKAFVLVGHSHWGKSETIYSLIKSRHKLYYYIDGKVLDSRRIFIRHASNDDHDKDGGIKGYLNCVKYRLNPANNPYVIIPFCPAFDRSPTAKILNTLKSKYDLYFWVMKYRYGITEKELSGQTEISNIEINRLKSYTKCAINIYKEEDADSDRRAKSFKEFILKNL